MPFDGICIGGLAGDESAAQRRAALDVCVPLLADDPRPRYLMGLGSPADLLDAVDAGIDMFDSVLPARVARNGTVLVPEGRLNLRNSRFLDDPAPIQEGCRCRACRSFSRAYLAHLLRADELLFYPTRHLPQPDLPDRLHGSHPVGSGRGQVPATCSGTGRACAIIASQQIRGVYSVTRKLAQSRSELAVKRSSASLPITAEADRDGYQGSPSQGSKEEAQGQGQPSRNSSRCFSRRRQSVEVIKPKRKPRWERRAGGETRSSSSQVPGRSQEGYQA